MNVRLLVFPVVACVFAAVSCGPTEQAQTVSFVLSLDSERLSEVEFVVGYRDGQFAGTDGQCEVSAAAGPRSFAESEARLLEKDRVRVMSRAEKRVHAAAVRATAATPSTTLPGELAAPAAIEPTGTGVCGDGTVDDGEICDDNNVIDDDGCSADCEFAFSSMDDEQGELTIRIGNIKGIPPGAALAFCKFQGDLVTGNLVVQTLSCDRPTGSCTPTTDAIIGVSTTTTTTTTTTSSTTTTTGDGDTTTSSTTDTRFP